MQAERPPRVTCRTFYDAATLRVGHMDWLPLESPVSVDGPREHVLVLPLAGAFARHGPAPGEAICTPSHAMFFPAGRGYVLSHPGRLGDQVITLGWSDAALEAVAPGTRMPEAQVLLQPRQVLGRALLWWRCARGEVDPLEVESLATALLASCLEAAGWPRAPCSPRSRARRRIDRVREAVAVAPAQRWSLGELAGIASLSACQLARVFREEVGITVHAYVVRQRLARALEALLHTDRGITDIALESGFASHSHFTARFRREFGVVPASVRRERRAVGGELHKIVTARHAA